MQSLHRFICVAAALLLYQFAANKAAGDESEKGQTPAAQVKNSQMKNAQVALAQWMESSRRGDVNRVTKAASLQIDQSDETALQVRVESQPVSDKITALPPQSSIFGRLAVSTSKLKDDNLSFYKQTEKQVAETSRMGREGEPMLWNTSLYTWAAPDLYHQPLYFEEVNLERYGNGPWRIVQSPVSAAHFFTNIAVLPYHVASRPPRQQIYNLGHYRPGDFVPHRYHRAPFSVKGFVAQGAAAAGVVLIP